MTARRQPTAEAWPEEPHMRIAEHPDAAGGSFDGGSPVAATAGIVRLTAMRSAEKPGYAGRHLVPDTWTLVLTLSGGGEVACGGETWHAEGATVYVIPPGMPFTERQAGDGDWRYLCFQVTVRPGTVWMELRTDGPLHRSVRPEMIALLQHVVDVLHRRPSGLELTAVGLCLAVFGELRAEPLGSAGGKRQLVMKAQQLIEAAGTYAPSVAELATRCKVSPSTLAHAFKADTGYSVHAYVLRHRVQQAKGLLLAGARVGEAADRLGFSNPFHFSRVFCRHEGVSPRQFLGMAGKRVPAGPVVDTAGRAGRRRGRD